MIDLQKIYIQGLQKKQEQRKTTTNYRGGNTGVQVTDDLHNAGSPNTCQRVIIARANGRETEPDWRTNLMFDAGHMNEIRWREYFELAGYKIKDGKQLEGLIKWETSNGKTVTGSPDAIVTDKKGKEYLIEHKHLSSFWSFNNVVMKGEPKLDNLAQAAHYSLKTGIDAVLVYTASTLFSGPKYLTNSVPHPTDKGSEDYDYTYKKKNGKINKKSGKPEYAKINVPGNKQVMWPKDIFREYSAEVADFKNTLPTIKQFDLRWVGDSLEYYNGSEWKDTIITKQAIDNFYTKTWEAEQKGVLPPRPVNLGANGEPKKYTACVYCTLSEVCDRFENDFDTWLREALLITY